MTIFILIFLVLLFIYSPLIDYYRRGWNSLAEYFGEGTATIKVSVVVAARNEEHNIDILLRALSKQRYPINAFEVIIVDDHSIDSTWLKLSSYDAPFQLRLFQLPFDQHGKKQAIAFAIDRAGGGLILQTDADCIMGQDWISAHANIYQQTGAKFIAAPVRIQSKNSVLGVFQSLDFLTLQTITGASVHKRMHNMCNGANMSFDRKAFIEVNGFAGIDNIPSGDDMLLMQKISDAYPNKIFFLKDAGAIVDTAASKTWKDFFNQRVRWSSKAVYYKDKKIYYALLLTYLLNLCFVALTAAVIVNTYWLPFLSLFLLAKVLIEFPLVNAGALFFRQQPLLKWFPLLQPLHIFYVIIAGWLGRFGSYEWKSRVVKNNDAGKLAKQ